MELASLVDMKLLLLILHRCKYLFLIKKAAKIEKGSSTVPLVKVGKISESQLEEIAKTKMDDINANDIDADKKIVEGTARSMGV